MQRVQDVTGIGYTGVVIFQCLQSPSEMPGSPKVLNSLFPAELEGQKRVKRRVSEMYWGRPGWTGTKYTGRSVGCPELPDGSM